MRSRLGSSSYGIKKAHIEARYDLHFHFQTGMFSLFGDAIGLSDETGYDWTQPSSEAMGEQQSFQDTTTALPGTILLVEQVSHTSQFGWSSLLMNSSGR